METRDRQETESAAPVPPPAFPGRPTTTEDLIVKLVPYKNPVALAAYYVGVFSIIPCVGIFLGIAAVGLGIGGLNYAKHHPESAGKVHAWVGIVLGGLFGLLYLGLSVLFYVRIKTMH